jgi:hypothetical protein
MLMMKDVTTLLDSYLTSTGRYSTMPVMVPGPATNVDAEDYAPEALVIISLWPGQGLVTEGLFDRAGVQLRTIGKQMDYQSAELLAMDCDKAMTSIEISQHINGKWVVDIWRAGGSPTLVLKDDGDRYHFFCNYIWEVEY